MSQQLQATYYAGIKPQAQQVIVWLEPGNFHIRFTENHVMEDRYWDVDKIKPDLDDRDQKFILRYGQVHPFEFLEFDDPDAEMHLKNAYPSKNWKQKENLFTRNPLMAVSTIIGFFLLIGIGAYFLLVPKISDVLASGVPVKWEVELGDKLSGGLINSNLEDKARSNMLDSFFIMLDIPSKYPIHFHYINDSIVNAFAMPGGNIVIHKGLMDKIKSYESLAGLIGHEFTHVEHKHSLKTIFRSMSSFILISAFLGDLTGLAGIILENANTIQNLSYSRVFEKEADANAVDLLLDRKIGLTGMLDLFHLFLDEEKPGAAIPKFLSTHPVTEDRIAYVKSRMSQKESDLVFYANLNDVFNRLKGN